MSTSEIATVLAWHDALNSETSTPWCRCPATTSRSATPTAPRRATPRCASGRSATPSDIEVGQIYYHDGVVVVEES